MPHNVSKGKACFWVGAVAGLFLAGAPAQAGHYVFDEENTTCSGTAATTCTNSYSPYYPGETNNMPSVSWSGVTQYGTISGSVTETLKFHWVPNEGENEMTDPPVADVWCVNMELENTGFEYTEWGGAGSANYTITFGGNGQSATYSGSCSTTQATYDEFDTMLSPWSVSQSSSGEQSIQVEFLLEGTDPEIELTSTGSGEVGGDMTLKIGLTRGAPMAAGEAIKHYTPNKLVIYPPQVAINANGHWRGFAGVNYNVEQSFKAVNGNPEFGYGLLWANPGQGGQNNVWKTWAGLAITPAVGGLDYESKVKLLKQAGAGWQSTNRVSTLVFRCQ